MNEAAAMPIAAAAALVSITQSGISCCPQNERAQPEAKPLAEFG
jgi:hypothetical protein